MGERPADRAAVADLEVPDQRDGAGQERHEPSDIGIVLDRGLGRGGTDPHGPVAFVDAPKFLDTAQVDDVPEHGKAHRQQWDEALATGQDLDVVEIGQQLEDAVDRVGRVIVERCRLHLASPRR